MLKLFSLLCLLCLGSCTPTTYFIMSDTSNLVIGPDVTGQVPAVISAGFTSPFAGSSYIWDRATVSDTTVAQTCLFLNYFWTAGTVTVASLQVAASNSVRIWINGINAGCDHATSSVNSPFTCNVLSLIRQGQNMIEFSVTTLPGGTPATNPGLLAYKMTITANV
jgi:hypothetical protein